MDTINDRMQTIVDRCFDGNKSQFAKALDLPPTSISNYLGDKRKSKPSSDILCKILNVVNDLSARWLLTGTGNMFSSEEETSSDQPKEAKETLSLQSNDDTYIYNVPLLPMMSQGGVLNEFTGSATLADCEMVVSPIKGVDFAIQVSGDSMHPEYPSGSRVLIKRITDPSFIEWGRAYVLDTQNGVIIKIVVPSEKEDCIRCVSVNKDPIYAPFDVPKSSIYGIYRVLMCMIMK